MLKAYSYIRFSSPEQAKGRSQARQFEECVNYCKLHKLNLAREEEYTFLDKGRSAYKAEHLGENGQLARFLRFVEDGTIAPGSSLIVESLDRLSREHVKHALPRFMDLLNKGINIVTLSDGRTYSSDFTEMDLILSIFVMSRAHEESSTKAKRVGDAWRNKRDKARVEGKPMGAAIPLWLKLEEGVFQIVPDRVKTVRRVFQWTIDGYGKIAISKALNAEGVPSFKGTTWGPSSIHKMLTNRAVYGIYQPHSVQLTKERQPIGEPILDYFPRIIEESMFFEAQSAMQGRRVAGATKQSKIFNVWQGLAKCGLCGASMHLINKGKPPKGNTYLHCINARKGMCTGKMLRLDGSELVFKEILAKVDSLSLVQDSSGKLAKELAVTNGRLSEQRTKLLGYVAGLEDGYSSALGNAISRTEQLITELEVTAVQLQTNLASEEITSKDDFFAKLDMESYEGRNRANALLKRLKIWVGINRYDKNKVLYLVVQNNEMILAVGCNASQLTAIPFVDGQLERVKIQDFDGTLLSSAIISNLEFMLRSDSWTTEEADAKIDALVNEAFERVESGDIE